MDQELVLVQEAQPGVAVLRISRPQALNALNAEVLDFLERALNWVEQRSIRVAVVTGEGDRAFVAGADIEVIRQIPDADAAQQFAERGQRLFQRFSESPVFFIAAINGYALGGGLELAMALDYRMAQESARLGQPEINLGIIPGFGGTQRLARLVGPGRALWMVASGDAIAAGEAQSMGLVDEVVDASRLMDEALARAHKLAQKAPLALIEAKRLVLASRDRDLTTGFLEEARSFSKLAVSHDGREGTDAFLSKRKPDFLGE